MAQCIRRIAICFFLCLALSGCEDSGALAPVYDAHQMTGVVKPNLPITRKRITKQVHSQPNLAQPMAVSTVATLPTASPPISSYALPSLPIHMTSWLWPTRGTRVMKQFSIENKGINIAGKKGEPIYAIQAGRVVYARMGLRGYGNLIIIKHNKLYLSAYAHNSRVLVREGEWVKQGQKIAEMGKTGTDKVMLHLEVRRSGKPIDPLNLYKR